MILLKHQVEYSRPCLVRGNLLHKKSVMASSVLVQGSWIGQNQVQYTDLL